MVRVHVTLIVRWPDGRSMYDLSIQTLPMLFRWRQIRVYPLPSTIPSTSPTKVRVGSLSIALFTVYRESILFLQVHGLLVKYSVWLQTTGSY